MPPSADPRPPGAAIAAGAISRRSFTASSLGSLVLFLALKARGLVVVPLYALILEPASLGVVLLSLALAVLLAPLLHLGLPQGMLVELPHRSPREVSRGTTSLFGVVLVTAAVAALTLPALLARGPFGLASVAPHGLVIVAVAAGMALREASQVLPQLHRQTGFLAAVSLGIEYGSAALGLAFAAAGGGAAGLLWGTALGHLGGSMVAVHRSLVAAGGAWGWSSSLLAAALAVGVPVLGNVTLQSAVQAFERFLLGHLHGEAAVATFGMAVAIGSVVLAVAATVNLVFLPAGVRLLQGGPERLARMVEEMLRLATVLLGLCLAGSILLGGPAVHRLLPGRGYDGAAPVLPIAVAGLSLFTLEQLLQWVPLTVDRRVRGVVAVNVLVAAANVALDLLLVPPYGPAGAAAAGAGAWAVGLVAMERVARRSLAGWRTGPAVRAAALAGVASVAAHFAALPVDASLFAHLAAGLAFVAAYGAAAFASGSLRRDDLGLLTDALRRPRPAVGGAAAPTGAA